MEEYAKNPVANASEELPVKPDDSTSACGPGCNCGAPSGGGRLKTVVSIAVAVAVVGILAYKAYAVKRAAAFDGVVNYEMAVAFGSASQGSLDSFADLNRYAMDQDAVFVFLPDPGGRSITKTSEAAVLSVQKLLNGKGIKVGLFTLKNSSPDYKGISAQIPVPAVLVVSKGKGMGVVSGEATENNLLQAFVASSRASSCGPGGAASCAPGAPGCK